MRANTTLLHLLLVRQSGACCFAADGAGHFTICELNAIPVQSSRACDLDYVAPRAAQVCEMCLVRKAPTQTAGCIGAQIEHVAVMSSRWHAPAKSRVNMCHVMCARARLCALISRRKYNISVMCVPC